MSTKRSKTHTQKGFHSRGCYAEADTSGSPFSLSERPRSLSMGPSLIFANAIGELEAIAITAAWQGLFRCVLVYELPE